jgi:hypothetical protein
MLNTPGLSMFNGSCTAVASGIIQTTTPAVFNTGPPLHLACFNSTYPTWWNIDLTYVLEKSVILPHTFSQWKRVHLTSKKL